MHSLVRSLPLLPHVALADRRCISRKKRRRSAGLASAAARARTYGRRQKEWTFFFPQLLLFFANRDSYQHDLFRHERSGSFKKYYCSLTHEDK